MVEKDAKRKAKALRADMKMEKKNLQRKQADPR